MKGFFPSFLDRLNDVLTALMCVIISTVPTLITACYAVIKQSWLLGAVALIVFILSLTFIAMIIDHSIDAD